MMLRRKISRVLDNCSMLPNIAVVFLVLFLILLARTARASEIESICRSEQRQNSCGKCIEAHVGCAWCTDPDFQSEHRCDSLNNLQDLCPSPFLIRPSDNVTILSDRPLGRGQRQLRPQQIQINIRKGQQISFKVQYLNLNNDRNRDIYILNSETESRGVHIKYSSDCLGRQTEGQSCMGARLNDVITFTLSVTLRECDNRGDIVISVGVAGIREVVALYVTPVCSCPCEAIKATEMLSSHCHNAGNLVCGACVCIAGKTGRRCECDEEENQCRQSPSSALCSGRGRCVCGKCLCGDPEVVKGEFCECDIRSCPLYEGIMCSGKGTCDCGKCICDPDRTGQICECPIDNKKCMSEDGMLCNNRGECQCGACVCQENFDGELCEIVQENDYDQDSSEEHSTSRYTSGVTTRYTFTSIYGTSKPKYSEASDENSEAGQDTSGCAFIENPTCMIFVLSMYFLLTLVA